MFYMFYKKDKEIKTDIGKGKYGEIERKHKIGMNIDQRTRKISEMGSKIGNDEAESGE